jgi:hypothetical protein
MPFVCCTVHDLVGCDSDELDKDGGSTLRRTCRAPRGRCGCGCGRQSAAVPSTVVNTVSELSFGGQGLARQGLELG